MDAERTASRERLWAVALVVVIVAIAAASLIVVTSRPNSAPASVHSIDPGAICAGSPYPSLAPGEFNTIAVDCNSE